MPEVLTETAAEVAALIPRYSWELMDEEQRDALMSEVVLPRYMKTTADGVQTGPKFWGEMVGASPSAIKNRAHRLQQSQSGGRDEVARTLSPSTERHVKSGLRKAPELITEMVDELHDDPAFQAAVASANSQIDAKRDQRSDDRDRIERNLSEQEAQLERLRKDFRRGNYGDAERRFWSMEPDEEVAAFLRKQAERFRNLAEWCDALADRRRLDDVQLQEWLA